MSDFVQPLRGSESEMMEPLLVVKVVAVGLVSWTSCFILVRKLFSNLSFNSCNRIVSTIHAILGVTLAALSVEDWSCPVCPAASRSSDSQMTTLSVTLAYLIYDLICCLFDKNVDVANSVHHFVSIVGLVAGLLYQICGSEMVAALFITEISSPFLHAREVLKEVGYRDTDLNLAADFAFAIIFTMGRMIGGPYLAYVTVTAADNPLLIKVMALGLLAVSVFWFYKIARMVHYKLVKRSGRSKVA